MPKTIEIKVIRPTAQVPKYAHIGDSGFDFYTTEDIILQPSETQLINTGLIFNIPHGFELQVRPRSGLSYTTMLRISNSPGTVDSNYKQEVKIIATNMGNSSLEFKQGARIAQGIICPVLYANFRIVRNIENDLKRTGGFGSSGL